MAKQSAHSTNIAIGGAAMEDEIDSYTLSIRQDVPVVTGFGQDGPRRVVGNYDYELQLSGAPDFAASQIDATLEALIGDSDGATGTVDPTGNSAGANDPNYDGTYVLEEYSISGQQSGAVTYSARLQGSAALSRAVA